MPEENAIDRCSECRTTFTDITDDAEARSRTRPGASVCMACDESRFYCEPCALFHSLDDYLPCNIITSSCDNECGCRLCDECEIHLREAHCDGCSYCPSCGDNIDHDGDDEDEPSGEIVRPDFIVHDPVFHHGKKRLAGESTRFMAAEMEVAGTSDTHSIIGMAIRWSASVVRDGSLPETGFEINTSPAQGSAYLQQLAEFEGAMKGKAFVNKSCGCHVHIDARDMTYQDVRRLVFIYAKIEDLLFSIVSEDRRTNTSYCKKCGPLLLAKYGKFAEQADKKSVKGLFFKAVYDTTPNQSRNRRTYSASKQAGTRYNALNLHSWMYRGTIENRLHQGCLSANDIWNWSQLNGQMLDAACRLTDARVGEFTRMRRGDGELLAYLGMPAWTIDWTEKRIANNGKALVAI